MSCFYQFFIQLLIFLPRPSNALLLFSLGWALLSPPPFLSIFSFCCIPWYVYFLHSHSVCVFLWAIFLNYLIAIHFFFLLSTPSPCFLLFIGLSRFPSALVYNLPSSPYLSNHKSWRGRLCEDPRQERCSPRWVDRGGACTRDWLSGGNRFDHFLENTAGSL